MKNQKLLQDVYNTSQNSMRYSEVDNHNYLYVIVFSYNNQLRNIRKQQADGGRHSEGVQHQADGGRRAEHHQHQADGGRHAEGAQNQADGVRHAEGAQHRETCGGSSAPGGRREMR